MANNDLDKIINDLTQFEEFIKNGKNYVMSGYLDNFSNIIRSIRKKTKEIIQTERVLKIGVVGSVKVGKSSFINALIFGGNDVLPRAATPMTAALTKIVYSEKPYAKVFFYSESDWKVIQNNAAKYDEEVVRLNSKEAEKNGKQTKSRFHKAITRKTFLVNNNEKNDIANIDEYGLNPRVSETLRACKELVLKAENNFDIISNLGEEKTIDVKDLNKDIKEYVGATGLYTPIVKHIELGINNPLLKDLELIDTPGLNDPILSRSEKTKVFLAECDAVFVLSYTSQFMNEADMNLIRNILPDESIGRIILVGTKFDSALLDYNNRNRVPLQEAMRHTVGKFNKVAKENIANAVTQASGYSREVLSQLDNEITVQLECNKRLYYVSALLYQIGQKKEENVALTTDDEKYLEKLDERFDGIKKDAAFLKSLSGIDNIREKEFSRLKQDKESLIEERSRNFFNQKLQVLLKSVISIELDLQNTLQLVQNENIERLEEKYKKGIQILDNLKRQITGVFENKNIDIESQFSDMVATIRKQSLSDDYSRIKVGSETRREKYTTESGFWIFKKKKTHVDYVEYDIASTNDVVSNIKKFIVNQHEFINYRMETIIPLKEINRAIKSIIVTAFETADVSFSEDEMTGPLEIALKRITVPLFSFLEVAPYINMVQEKYSGIVEGHEIEKLRLLQESIKERIVCDITELLQSQRNLISGNFLKQGIKFHDDISNQFKEKVEILKNNISNEKEFLRNIESYSTGINEIKNYIMELI